MREAQFLNLSYAMPKLTLDRSIFIESPVDSVFPAVRDFKHWPIWSPWSLAEPDCSVTFSEDGRKYEWDGKIIGSGNIVVDSETPNREIVYTLTFLKPWKSTAKVKFLLQPKDGGTELHWTMDSSLPFFLFWMKGMMTAAIARDYDRGLLMIKDLAETGAVPSALEFPGKLPVSGFKYIGIRRSSSLDDIGSAMSAAFEELTDWMKQNDVAAAGAAFSLYHKFAMVKGVVDYTAGVPVADSPANLPSSLTSGEIPTHETYQIKHVGPYRHLANAWAAGTMRARAKVFKQSKAAPPFEVYNQWTETPELERLTTVHFPSK